MTGSEVELKFSVARPEEFAARALRSGFRLLTPRTLEHNTLYDTPGRKLRAAHQVLRLRRYGERWVMTHKRPAEGVADERYKERVETETGVEDGAALAEVFGQLGCMPVFQYEKYRTELEDTFGGGHLVIDETPIGNFAELEGERGWIDQALVRLGVPPEATFTDSYGRMFLDWKQLTGSAAEHMLFSQIAADGGKEAAEQNQPTPA